jgi:hypothetical protein
MTLSQEEFLGVADTAEDQLAPTAPAGYSGAGTRDGFGLSAAANPPELLGANFLNEPPSPHHGKSGPLPASGRAANSGQNLELAESAEGEANNSRHSSPSIPHTGAVALPRPPSTASGQRRSKVQVRRVERTVSEPSRAERPPHNPGAPLPPEARQPAALPEGQGGSIADFNPSLPPCFTDPYTLEAMRLLGIVEGDLQYPSDVALNTYSRP